MAYQTKSPGTMADSSAVGTKAWTDPDNAKTNDGNTAVASDDFDAPWTTHYLKATNFGFAIPTGATINGIVVEIEERDGSGSENFYDSAVKIVKADGSIGTTNKGNLATAWTNSTTYTTYGANNNLWDESWSEASIEDTDFGVVLSVVTPNEMSFAAAQVDHIQITVYYTEAVSTQVRVGGEWKPVSATQVYITNAWKPVTKLQIQISSVWKTVFG